MLITQSNATEGDVESQLGSLYRDSRYGKYLQLTTTGRLIIPEPAREKWWPGQFSRLFPPPPNHFQEGMMFNTSPGNQWGGGIIPP
jgi:hypothetical protein